MINGFLLDIDGTLVDSNDFHAKAWQETLQHFGYNTTYEEVRVLIGMGGDRLLPTVVPGLSVDHGKGEEIAGYRRKYFLQTYVSQLQPTKGARALVLALKERNIRLIIATSASNEEIDRLLRAADVHDLIHEYTTANDVRAAKPAPDIVKVALDKIKLSSHEVYMLGDTPYDIASATKCGVKTIALQSGGFSDAQLKGAIKIYRDPADLKKNLDEVLSL